MKRTKSHHTLKKKKEEDERAKRTTNNRRMTPLSQFSLWRRKLPKRRGEKRSQQPFITFVDIHETSIAPGDVKTIKTCEDLAHETLSQQPGRLRHLSLTLFTSGSQTFFSDLEPLPVYSLDNLLNHPQKTFHAQMLLMPRAAPFPSSSLRIFPSCLWVSTAYFGNHWSI